MASSTTVDVRKTPRKLCAPRWMQEAVVESGSVVRKRKVDPMVLFWTVVPGFGSGSRRALAGLRSAHERIRVRTSARNLWKPGS